MTNTPLTKEELRQFTGSETWYRHGLVRSVLYTEGAKYLAEKGGAYWLLDEIALAQKTCPALAAEAFQLWKLRVKPNGTAMLTCEDGNGKRLLREQIAYTDFPLDEITFYVTGNVILLPTEY
jgi:hypothetical protein